MVTNATPVRASARTPHRTCTTGLAREALTKRSPKFFETIAGLLMLAADAGDDARSRHTLPSKSARDNSGGCPGTDKRAPEPLGRISALGCRDGLRGGQGGFRLSAPPRSAPNAQNSETKRGPPGPRRSSMKNAMKDRTAAAARAAGSRWLRFRIPGGGRMRGDAAVSGANTAGRDGVKPLAPACIGRNGGRVMLVCAT